MLLPLRDKYPSPMKVGIAGDWHGNGRWAVSCLNWFAEQGVDTVYQVGDFGLWPGPDGEAYLQEIMSVLKSNKQTLWVTPGNHEDYSQIEDPENDVGIVPPRQLLGFGKKWELAILPRGYRWEIGGKVFVSFGGAPSIDYHMRAEGKSWWPEEMIRETDFLRIDGEVEAVDVLLAHDSPNGGTASVQAIIDNNPMGWPKVSTDYAKLGRDKMTRAVGLIDPFMFFHGHYHVSDHRYDSIVDRHYVSMHMDGKDTNIGILSWGVDSPLFNVEENDMSFEFFGRDSWI